MTIVEFFDQSPTANLISCLVFRPDKVIFIGEAQKMKQQILCYKKILAQKKITTEIVLKTVSLNKIDTIAELLSEIVEQEKDCIFDLTGGDAVSLAAMGMIYERYRNQKQIRMHHFDALTGCTKGCDFSGEAPKMTGQAKSA